MPSDTTATGHHRQFLIPGPISPFLLLLDPKDILSYFMLQYWYHIIVLFQLLIGQYKDTKRKAKQVKDKRDKMFNKYPFYY